MKIMKKINTQEIPVKRTFASLWMTVAMVLAFTGCSEEELMQPANGQAGTLHITSVSVDGQQVGGRSRVVADDETQYGYENAPYNQSLNSFGNGDKIKLSYNFGGAGDDAPAPVYATFNDGVWTIDGNIAPRAEEESETWRLLEMTATANAHKELNGDPEEEEEEDDDIYDEDIEECADGGEEESEYAAAARVLGIVAGDGIESANIRLLTDFLYATIRDGSISIDKNLTSPTLGATTISFKHASRALLRLPIPEGGFNVAGTYVVNGTAHHVTGLATLWSVVKAGEYTYYYPLTAVGSNLQAIVYSGVSVVGFKAVLTTDASGAVGSNGFDASKTFTLDLPFKVDNTASTGIELAENTQYPLTLTLSPNQAVVNLASATGKPGWGTNVQEHEFDNSPNDMFKEAMRELKFVKETNSVGTFEVSGPNGLMVLNKWMTGSITFDKFKSLNFEGAANFTSSYSRLKQNIKLMTDITLPAVGTGESNWIPIGNSIANGTLYEGTFNGNNHKITNLSVNRNSNFIGLIGSLSENGKVLNITLESANLSGEKFVGGILGYNFGGTVKSCIVNGNISGNGHVGGIVGENENGTLEKCTNRAQVIGKVNVGGIAGKNGSSIMGSTNYGTVKVPANPGVSSSDDVHIGGIVGCLYKNVGKVEGCMNEGIVTGGNNYNVGGIIGYLYDGCCYASANKANVSVGNNVGGIIGKTKYKNIYGCWTNTGNDSDGIGYPSDNFNTNVYGCYYGRTAVIMNSYVETMNTVLSSESVMSVWRWKAGSSSDSWPSLIEVTESSTGLNNFGFGGNLTPSEN